MRFEAKPLKYENFLNFKRNNLSEFENTVQLYKLNN